MEFIGTSTAEERSAFAQDGSFPVGAFVERSSDEHNCLRVFMSDAVPSLLAERLHHHEAAKPGYAEMWREINTRLTAIDGHAVWVEEYVSETLPHTLAAGELVPEGVVIVQSPGKLNACHESVMALYETGQLRHLFSGYALHKRSGFWVGHTWGMDFRGQLVETTTVNWSRYYGAPWKFRDESSCERQRRAAAKQTRRAERNRQLAHRPWSPGAPEIKVEGN